MYSLYRAWFGDEGCVAPGIRSVGPTANMGLAPPDTLVRVGNDGEHQFIAHRSVLAAHSGYLEALLANASTVAPGASSDNTNGNVASLSVSSVGSEAFAPLLNYMYTGRLEVTLDNIYSVLLATHLLHMPGALEQCRAALLKLRAPPTNGVLRPVPSRIIGPPLCWAPPTLYSASTLPPFPNLRVPPAVPVCRMPLSRSHEPQPNPSTYLTEQFVSSRASTSYQRSQSPDRSPSPGTIRGVETGPALSDLCSSSPEANDEHISVTDSESPRDKRSRRCSPNEQSSTSSNVVIDIACCDGPVRFHRVLNANYTESGDRRTEESSCGNQGDEKSNSENDENVCEKRTMIAGAPSAQNSPSESGNYTCEYCRHTFKSQYCYQKHAKRHLHSTDDEGQTSSSRREVRLLDLNVQYYPCKICGSKFPSYYFVHKHRKLCHGGGDNM